MVDDIPRRGRRRQRAEGFEAEGDPGLSEDDDLNDIVRDSIPAPEPLSDLDTSEQAQDFTPRNRMAQVGDRDRKYQQEYRLKLVHRMLMRGIPLDQIAAELDVTVRTIQRDRNELYSRLREAAKNFDLNHYIGDHLGFYQEGSAMAMRAASNSRTPINHRLAALRTATAIRQAGTRLLDTVGVFDVVRYKPERDKGNEDIRRLTNLAQKLLGDDEGKEREEQTVARQIPESALFDPAVLDDDEEEVHVI
jgi:hypothetical protein